ncbi:MAG: hypothetical protein WBP94_10035 [Rhodomicrobiaceae bacterium]
MRASKALLYGAVWITAAGAANAALAAPFETTLSTLGDLETLSFHGPDFLVLAENRSVGLKAGDVSGPPGRPIPLQVQVLGESGENQLLIFTGLPQGVKLAPGGNFGRFWAVNSSVVSTLTLTAPEGFSGTFTITVAQKQDVSPSTNSTSFRVTIGEQPATSAAPSNQDESPKPANQPNPNEPLLLGRANQLFHDGDVSGARSILEYLALQGSATAAMALAETYDPAVLSKMVIKGLEPDPQKAREWYLKAEQLGGTDARSRLESLATR